MTDPLTWQAVVAKLIDHIPALVAALVGTLAYLQSRRNGANQAESTLAAVAAANAAKEVTTVVTQRSDSQDHQLNKIEQATNGGVQKLRDEVASLKVLLATTVEELRAERAKP